METTIFTQPTALVVNSTSSVSKKLIELFSSNDVSVISFSTEGKFSKFPSVKEFSYCVVFLNEPNPSKKESLIWEQFISPATRVVYVVPFWWGRKTIESIKQNNISRLVVVAEAIGPGMDFDGKSFVTKTFQSLAKNETPTGLENQGVAYIAGITDLAQGILQALFTSSENSTTWLVTLGISTNVFTNLLRLSPAKASLTSNNFELSNQNDDVSLPPGTKPWVPTTRIEQLVNETLSWISQLSTHRSQTMTPSVQPTNFLDSRPQQVPQQATKENNQPSLPASKRLHRLGKPGIIFLVIIFFFLLSILIALAYPVFQVNSAIQLATKGRLADAVASARQGYRGLIIIDQSLIAARPLLSIGPLAKPYQFLQEKISLLETSAYIEHSFLRFGSSLQLWLETEKANVSRLPAVMVNLNSVIDALSFLPPNLPNSSINILKDIRSVLPELKIMFPSIPSLAGYDQPRTYLLLFQNNMELRPTGGFIGSYGIATIKQGQLADVEIHNIYSADGQLKGHVEPPEPIKNILGEAGWYMRDSNWDPDFPTSAGRAEWFLEKETGRTVDGTIAITPQLTQSLLTVTGPLRLVDFQEEITDKNLYERSQYHAEINSFPGSTQKQDFLGSVARALIEKLSKLSSEQKIEVAQAINKSLIQKDIQLNFHDPVAQNAISELNWGGQIKPERKCLKTNCLSDSLLIVDSNMGVNKANYFLKKRYLLASEITLSGEVLHTLTAEFNNTATSNSWPAGTYKSYLRVYLPLGTQVKDITLRDPNQDSSNKILRFDSYQEHGKSITGFVIEVPIKETRILSVSYQNPARLESSKQGSLLFSWEKQAGTQDEPASWTLKAPSNFRISAVPQGSFDLPSSIRYNLTLSQNQFIELDLIPTN